VGRESKKTNGPTTFNKKKREGWGTKKSGGGTTNGKGKRKTLEEMEKTEQVLPKIVGEDGNPPGCRFNGGNYLPCGKGLRKRG